MIDPDVLRRQRGAPPVVKPWVHICSLCYRRSATRSRAELPREWGLTPLGRGACAKCLRDYAPYLRALAAGLKAERETVPWGASGGP